MTSVRLGTISLISLGPQLQKYSQISSCRHTMDRPHVLQYQRKLEISNAEQMTNLLNEHADAMDNEVGKLTCTKTRPVRFLTIMR